jgi:glutamate dehydrogenase
MGWFADEYYKIKGAHLSSVITSKPLAIGGSKGRDTATGRGVFFTILEAAKAFNIELKGARVSLQGYGNAAQPIARYLHETGCKIVAVSDSTGGAYDSDGMDPKQLVDHKTKNGSVKGFPGSRELSVTDPISVDCDILVPAALENQLTEENASEVKAKLVAEAANGPTTTEADRILHEKGVVVLPDVLANAGGVAVSYFEWVQNRMGYYWSNEEVDDKLRVTMANAFENVHTNMEKYKIDMRTAAYVTAVQKIVDAMRALGRI